MTASPAFTPVVARRTLTKDQPVPAPAKPTQFSPAVVDYVQRAFFEFNRHKDSPTFAAIKDTDIRAKLSAIVNQATQEGIVHERDWTTYPLPHKLILEERQHAAMYSAQDAILANINTSTEPPTHGTQPNGAPTKKRKSPVQEVADDDGRPVTPPWKKKNNAKTSLADRITGKSKTQEKKQKNNDKPREDWFDTSKDTLERRRQRFGQQITSPEPSPFHSSRDESPSAEANEGPIVGTCQTLEKQYFRLTSPPHPNTVRPLPVLEKALDHVLDKWKREHNYTYVCDQMKSLRQDLTVQRIKTPFTIRVYEMHARIALQMKDLGEYNQCQTQLRALYKLRLGENGSSGGKKDEFTAYHVLYLIYTRSRVDMNNMLADLTTADKSGPFVRLALQVRAALASGNYHGFFKIYAQAQDKNMFPYLMDMFIERERLSAMATICKAYKPDVSSQHLTKELAFDCEEAQLFENDVHRAFLDFMKKHSGENLIQEKGDDVRIITGKAGNVFEMAKRAACGPVVLQGPPR